jgi:hypothetical protein
LAEKNLGGLFMTFLLMIVGLALTPTVQDSVTTAAGSVTGAALAMVNLVPLFWVIIILAIGVAAVYVQLKGSG